MRGMQYNGIVVVGDRLFEYEKVANYLCMKNNFEVLRVISDDSQYGEIDVISKENIKKIEKDRFLLTWEKSEHIYAIFKEEFEEIINKKSIPLIVLPQCFYENFTLENMHSGQEFMSIYLYSLEDDVAINHKSKSAYINNCTYSIVNKCVEHSSQLIEKLWELRNSGGGLSREVMQKMMQCDLLIADGKIENISNASYDLCLGDEYYYAGEINKLSEMKPFIAIEPYDYVIASCSEKIIMPRDVSARFDVSVNLFCQGIILSNSTQVDPGFRGKLFCLLFNTSNKVVYLKRNMHYATIEFNKLVEPTTAYVGKYANEDSIVPYLPTNVMQGAINELKREIEKLKVENQKMQSIYLSVLAMFLAIISIFLVFK